MSEYPLKPLGDICVINPDTLAETSDPAIRYRYIDLSSVKEQKVDLSIAPLPFADLPSRARRRVAFNDVLLGTVRPNLKNFAIIESEDDDLLCSTGFAVLRSTATTSDPHFVFHAINSEIVARQLSSLVTGSNYPAVNATQVADLLIPVPPLPEQKKIAEILSGVDKVIDLTKRKLASERDLRVALLNEMIAENRPFLKLEMVATRVSGHTPSKSNSEYWNGGIPWVSLSDMAKLDKRFICDTFKEISEQGIRNSSAVLHPAGLVILSRDARVGCSAITAKEMAVSQHFIGWICSERLLNTYLYYVLQKWKKKFEAIAMGSTIATIGVPFFRDLEIPVPPIAEQQKVASALESIDDSIDRLEDKVVCLKNLKNALASDILSGRKRVSV